MLFDVIVQVVEGLNLLELVNGDGNLVGCLHNGDEVYISKLTQLPTYPLMTGMFFKDKIVNVNDMKGV